MSQEQPLYSDSYKKILDLAARYAAGASDHVIRVKHLLAAFLDTDADTFREILGVERLIRPENLSFEAIDVDSDGVIYHSSQVSRILSLHGGRMGEMMDAFGSARKLGIPQLAAAMLIKPCGPVLDLLQLNAIMSSGTAYSDAVMKRAPTVIDAEFKKFCFADECMGQPCKKIGSCFRGCTKNAGATSIWV